jgi:hypothetical protein
MLVVGDNLRVWQFKPDSDLINVSCIPFFNHVLIVWGGTLLWALVTAQHCANACCRQCARQQLQPSLYLYATCHLSISQHSSQAVSDSDFINVSRMVWPARVGVPAWQRPHQRELHAAPVELPLLCLLRIALLPQSKQMTEGTIITHKLTAHNLYVSSFNSVYCTRVFGLPIFPPIHQQSTTCCTAPHCSLMRQRGMATPQLLSAACAC